MSTSIRWFAEFFLSSDFNTFLFPIWSVFWTNAVLVCEKYILSSRCVRAHFPDSFLLHMYQRNVCSPAGLLSHHLTSHFLKVRITLLKSEERKWDTLLVVCLLGRKSSVTLFLMFPLQGLVCASMRCAHPAAEVNKALSQISRQCPLLLVSTMVMVVLQSAKISCSIQLFTNSTSLQLMQGWSALF